MTVLRCDGCGARFASTPEGHEAAKRHIRDAHPNPMWGWVFIWGITGLVILVQWLRGAL